MTDVSTKRDHQQSNMDIGHCPCPFEFREHVHCIGSGQPRTRMQDGLPYSFTVPLELTRIVRSGWAETNSERRIYKIARVQTSEASELSFFLFQRAQDFYTPLALNCQTGQTPRGQSHRTDPTAEGSEVRPEAVLQVLSRRKGFEKS